MKRKRPAGGGKPMSCRIAGERAVDVHRQRLDPRARLGFERLHEEDAVTGDPFGARHVEQHLHARIGRVHAMAESGQPPFLADGRVDRALRGRGRRQPFAFARARPSAMSSMQLEPAPP